MLSWESKFIMNFGAFFPSQVSHSNTLPMRVIPALTTAGCLTPDWAKPHWLSLLPAIKPSWSGMWTALLYLPQDEPGNRSVPLGYLLQRKETRATSIPEVLTLTLTHTQDH